MNSLGKSLLLAILGSMVAVSGAHADFRLRVEDLSLPGVFLGQVVTDNGPGDSSPITGFISFFGSTGISSIRLTAFSKPIVGGTTDLAQLFLDVQLIQAANPDSIRITLEDTNYTGGPNGALFLNANLQGFLGPGSATFQSWVNPANLVPALGPDSSLGLLPAIGGTPAGSVAACSPAVSLTTPPDFLLSKTCSASFSKGGPYSLFAQATLNLTQSELAIFSDRQQVQASPHATPEPSSLLLTVAGLVALVLRPFIRRCS
jgi:hypothetical protein